MPRVHRLARLASQRQYGRASQDFISKWMEDEPKKPRKRRRSSRRKGRDKSKGFATIYCLKDGDTVFYVGQTMAPVKRYCQHLRATKQRRGHKIKSMLEEGCLPHMVVLCHVPANQTFHRELDYTMKWWDTIVSGDVMRVVSKRRGRTLERKAMNSRGWCEKHGKRRLGRAKEVPQKNREGTIRRHMAGVQFDKDELFTYLQDLNERACGKCLTRER